MLTELGMEILVKAHRCREARRRKRKMALQAAYVAVVVLLFVACYLWRLL